MKPVYDVDQAIRIKGQWKLDLNGQRVAEGPNVVTTNGKEYVASFLQSAAAAPSTFTMKYLAIGTDATAESAAQTALGIEVSRATGTVSYVSGQIYQVTATFATGSGTGGIVECGLFSSNSGGTMLARKTVSIVNKGSNDTLTVTAQFTLS